MSLRITNKQAYKIVILVIILFFLGFSARHLPDTICSKPIIDSTIHHNIPISSVSSDQQQINSSSPKSTHTSTTISISHCPKCRIVTLNDTFNFKLSSHHEVYLPIKSIPEYKEFIPELKPPRIA